MVLVYSPYNYPFQLSLIPLITALVAGNAVILKCSEKTPAVAALIADLCLKCQLPPDLVQVVDDPPDSALALLSAEPNMVFFTGSSAAGRMIAKRSAELLIPAVLELGGKDPCVVFADCNLDRTVEGVVYGAFSNAGQVCVGIKRLYVQESIHDVFLQKLVSRVASLRIGDSEEADLSLFHAGPSRDRLASQIEDAVRKGARIEWPPQGMVSGESPVLLTGVSQDSRLMREETFGPVVCIFPFRDATDAIARVNAVPFALSSSVWTRNSAQARAVAGAISAGSCAINDVIRNVANPYASFGGNGLSGYGRYHGPQGLFAFSRTRSTMIADDTRDRERHWFPFTVKTFNSLNHLLKLRHSSGGVASFLRRIIPLLFCGVLSLAVESQSPPHPGHLIVSVNCPERSHGEVGYLVFASPGGFPNDKSKALMSGFAPLPPNESHMSFDAGELAPGRYAVSVYLDVNGNKRLDVGHFGIPREPVGASNNPVPRFGPPRFDECAFTMRDGDQKIAILLVKHND